MLVAVFFLVGVSSSFGVCCISCAAFAQPETNPENFRQSIWDTLLKNSSMSSWKNRMGALSSLTGALRLLNSVLIHLCAAQEWWTLSGGRILHHGIFAYTKILHVFAVPQRHLHFPWQVSFAFRGYLISYPPRRIYQEGKSQVWDSSQRYRGKLSIFFDL